MGRPPRPANDFTGRSARFVVRPMPGGCVPGELSCECGHAGLSIWDPQFGALCEHCRSCWGFTMRYAGPGQYRMKAIPAVAALLA